MTKPTYDFDDAFQSKVAAMAVRDVTFNVRTEGLIKPEYFLNTAEAHLVSLTQQYWNRYKAVPSDVVLVRLIKAAMDRKIIRSDEKDEVVEKFKEMRAADLSDRDYVIDEVAAFAKHQAIIAAMEKSLPAMEKHEFDSVEAYMTAAFQVAANDASVGHDVLGDIEARTERRKDIAVGKIIPAITTGVKELDDALGGGAKLKELLVILGPAKAGKSFGLMNIAVNAQLAGKNVLYITLENSVEVTTDRIDAYLSQIETNNLLKHIIDVEAKVRARLAKAGTMKIHEYGTGTFAPKDLRRLVETYKAKGLIFDMIVVDYWDIMAPDLRYKDDSIRESASIGMGLRALAKDENVAMVTAIQSNRDGFKAFTAKAEHAAEDFNKVRLADAMFSINATDEERENKEARLYMAAVRNMAGGHTITIEQDLARATFITKVLGKGSV
ncbi:MAG: hypothetical protein LPK02_07560 [Rhodobacterales bacterium]|nr:hypothetical protein [Rhodobacterales bacterium]